MAVPYRINNVTFGLILAATAVVDLIGFLLALTVIGSIVGTFMGVLAGILLWITFMIHGVKYSGTAGLKKVAATFGTMVLEMIPMINALPMVTTGAVIVVLQSRIEDIAKAKEDEERRVVQQKQQARLAAQQAAMQRAANNNIAQAQAKEAA
jgi:hypothetical protein